MLRRSVPAPMLVLGSVTSVTLGATIATPLLHEIGPGITTAFRLLIAAVLLLAVHRPPLHVWHAREWGAIVRFGLVLAAMNWCFYEAISRIPIGLAVTIEFAGPLVLSTLMSRRLRDVLLVLAAAAAIVVIGLDSGSGAGRLDPLGILFALAAATCWAGYILAGRSLGRRVAGHGALAVGMGVAAIVVLPFGVAGTPRLVASPLLLLPLLAVSVLSSFVPYSLEFAALRRLRTATFGVLLALEPVIASIAGWLLLGQALDVVRIVAMAVVVGASVASTLSATPPGLEARDGAATGLQTDVRPVQGKRA